MRSASSIASNRSRGSERRRVSETVDIPDISGSARMRTRQNEAPEASTSPPGARTTELVLTARVPAFVQREVTVVRERDAQILSARRPYEGAMRTARTSRRRSRMVEWWHAATPQKVEQPSPWRLRRLDAWSFTGTASPTWSVLAGRRERDAPSPWPATRSMTCSSRSWRSISTGEPVPVGYASGSGDRMITITPGRRASRREAPSHLTYLTGAPARETELPRRPARDGEVELQSWAIIDNASVRDWDVRLGVGAGSAGCRSPLRHAGPPASRESTTNSSSTCSPARTNAWRARP